MDPKSRILEFLSTTAMASGKELRELLGVSRQALSVHLRALIESGAVVKSGSTRGARYSLASHAPAPLVIERDLALARLDESEVYEELALPLGLRRQLRPNVGAIVRYAFTEMLNNAIDHSEADRCKVVFRLDTGTVSFEVRDPGIGLFHSIASKLQLADEQTAMLELLKGKTTTMRERHSGEGLFFTSRVADRFVLRSHKTQIEWSRRRDDVFVSARRFTRGTRVDFLVHRGTRRRLEDVFGEFAPAEYDFQFQKTRVQVKLLQTDYVSRSEAKRLIANLDRFREIVLDFKDVHSIGQGFADEVFRVFSGDHPDIKIRTRNANPVVSAMFRHVAGPDPR
jgi:biotin operon repressor/anti-sigma regulatory factor (Ser/Thr protein kinase)